MAQKRIIQGQPSYTETSQYNFSDDYSIDPPNYQDSSGLPANSYKFTRKDLCTIPKGDELNEAIIDRNLKFAGGNFIRIDTLRIVNAGVSHDIKNIKVRVFNFKTDSASDKRIGVVAQEIETVCPKLVDITYDKNEDGEFLETGVKSVKYSVLYMKAIKALQEAITKIETLETEVAALKAA